MRFGVSITSMQVWAPELQLLPGDIRRTFIKGEMLDLFLFISTSVLHMPSLGTSPPLQLQNNSTLPYTHGLSKAQW